ncbi:MAG: hypothetical protein A3J93_00995 [Candidatus Magasanikbacteria bacterium RIFOXYC2_FULL_42_28]|uniref:AbiEi antitoxin C-terminal domain-containing protein n=1 Tax=Candidatus Magasanikbacteria bacterium RIFOXYC2_FULL_42_28 TaxID=1798704 RepID=A0A1F6NXL9_9BACT|nr:MAG: hypothetical protein A3J93_00995 [Candidatus Magasanikbacteria bacterium RIFOXYC2_FULL_42_28]
MKIEKLEEKTQSLLLLSKKTLSKFEPSINNLNGNLRYWQKNGDLISLKGGLYILKKRYEKELEKGEYQEYISCQLVQPSYLSVEYVMAKYSLLTEAVYCITAMTTKKTRAIRNQLNTFRYYSLTPKLFTGYKVKYFLGAPIWEAEKEKAIFDFLYLRFIRNQPINEKVIDDLRINWDEVSIQEWERVKTFCQFTNSKKVVVAIMLIDKMYFSK